MSIALKNTSQDCGALERVYDHWRYTQTLFIEWDSPELILNASCSVLKAFHVGKIGFDIIVQSDFSLPISNRRDVKLVVGVSEAMPASSARQRGVTYIGLTVKGMEALVSIQSRYLRVEYAYQDDLGKVSFKWPKEVSRESFDSFLHGGNAESSSLMRVFVGNHVSFNSSSPSHLTVSDASGVESNSFTVALRTKLPVHGEQPGLITNGPTFVVGEAAWQILKRRAISASDTRFTFSLSVGAYGIVL
jgi:hypothetical protein